jgi:hypothetical protein
MYPPVQLLYANKIILKIHTSQLLLSTTYKEINSKRVVHSVEKWTEDINRMKTLEWLKYFTIKTGRKKIRDTKRENN